MMRIRATFSRLQDTLPDEKYYWRVTALDESKNAITRSGDNILNILSPQPPVLITPEANAVLVGDTPYSVAFSWTDPNRTGSALFELAEDAEFQKVLRDQVVIGNSQTMDLSSGEYYWRVTVVDSSGEPVTSPALRQFGIIETLQSPVLQVPAQGERLDMKNANNIRFTWRAVARANAYQFILYQGNGMREVYKRRFFDTTFLFDQITLLDRDRFTWEVQALLLENDGTPRTAGKPSRSDFFIALPELEKAMIVIPQILD